MPLEAQVKLLRALQQKEIEPVGSGKAIPINIRIIAATNRNPLQAVQQGYMREDLFYRLNVFPIHMPALRQRRDDIRSLGEYFLGRFNSIEEKSITHFSEEAIEWMESYDWPGNVRELENAVFRAVLLCDHDCIEREHISCDISFESHETVESMSDISSDPYLLSLFDASGSVKDMDTIKNEVEKLALDFYKNDVALTAHKLGIGKSTLYFHLQSKKAP